jgi:hypothetical protein
MRGTPSRQAAVERDWPDRRRPFESPAGFRLLVPGWPQFSWGQGERGWVLLGSFLVAAGAAVLAWGTWLSWCFFAFGFLVHVSSTTDAIRQASFPVYARRTAVPMIAGALAVLVYLPLLLTLIDTAWPGSAPERTQSVYLVNCWAYRDAAPRRGHWVWLRLPPLGRLHAARVVAAAGQELEWTGHEWKVDGQMSGLLVPLHNTAWPQAGRFKVPADQVLVEAEEAGEGGAPPSSGSLVLVPQDQIIGRAWARYYPVWDRRLL